MKINSSLFIPLYEFQCDENLIDKVLSLLPSTEFYPDVSNYHSNDFFDKELFDWFHECLTHVQHEWYHNDIEFQITDCWANKALRFQSTQPHFHLNSIVSGILYCSDEPSGGTVFKFDNPWLAAQNKGILQLGKDSKITCEVLPRKGKLIIFPSSIVHEVNPYKENSIRYTVAFNAFIKGSIGSRSTGKLKINSLGGIAQLGEQ